MCVDLCVNFGALPMFLYSFGHFIETKVHSIPRCTGGRFFESTLGVYLASYCGQNDYNVVRNRICFRLCTPDTILPVQVFC